MVMRITCASSRPTTTSSKSKADLALFLLVQHVVVAHPVYQRVALVVVNGLQSPLHLVFRVAGKNHNAKIEIVLILARR